MAYSMYVSDNHGKSTYYMQTGTDFWFQAVEQYYSKNETIRFCPEATDIDPSGGWGGGARPGRWPVSAAATE